MVNVPVHVLHISAHLSVLSIYKKKEKKNENREKNKLYVRLTLRRWPKLMKSHQTLDTIRSMFCAYALTRITEKKHTWHSNDLYFCLFQIYEKNQFNFSNPTSIDSY